MGTGHHTAVHVQVVANLAHTASMRRQVDPARGDVGQVLAIGGQVGALVTDVTGTCRQRDIAAVGQHAVHAQVAGGLFDEHRALGRHRQRTALVAESQAARHAVDQVGLDEVGRAAHGTGQCCQRDADAADVGQRRGVNVGCIGVDDAARRQQENAVGGGSDAAHTQVVAVSGVQRNDLTPGVGRAADEAVGQDVDKSATGVDVAGAQDVDHPGVGIGVAAVDGADAHVFAGFCQREAPGRIHCGGWASGHGRCRVERAHRLPAHQGLGPVEAVVRAALGISGPALHRHQHAGGRLPASLDHALADAHHGVSTGAQGVDVRCDAARRCSQHIAEARRQVEVQIGPGLAPGLRELGGRVDQLHPHRRCCRAHRALGINAVEAADQGLGRAGQHRFQGVEHGSLLVAATEAGDLHHVGRLPGHLDLDQIAHHKALGQPACAVIAAQAVGRGAIAGERDDALIAAIALALEIGRHGGSVFVAQLAGGDQVRAAGTGTALGHDAAAGVEDAGLADRVVDLLAVAQRDVGRTQVADVDQRGLIGLVEPEVQRHRLAGAVQVHPRLALRVDQVDAVDQQRLVGRIGDAHRIEAVGKGKGAPVVGADLLAAGDLAERLEHHLAELVVGDVADLD